MPFLAIAGIEVLVTDLAEQEPTLIGDTGRSFSGAWRGDTSGEIRTWRGTGLEVAASEYHRLRSAVRRGTVEVQGGAIYGGWSRRMRVTLSGEYVPSGTAYFIVPGFTMEDAQVDALAYLFAPDRTTGWTFSRASTATQTRETGLIETVATGILRDRHYVDGERSVLLELARTNLITQSENFGAWSTSGTPVATPGQADPLGGTAAYLLTDDDAAAQELYFLALTYTGDGTKAVSIFLKEGSSPAASGTRIIIRDVTASMTRMQGDVTWSGGAPVVSMNTGSHVANERLSGGWYRLIFRTTAVAAANAHNMQVIPAATGSQTGNVYAFGAMTENGQDTTSYVATAGTTVTRAVDILSRTLPTGASLPTDAWARYTRYVAGMDTNGGIANARIWQIGNDGGARALLYWGSTTQIILTATNTTSAAILSAAVARGDTVEALAIWNGDGTGTLALSINEGPVTSAAITGTSPGAAWNGGANTYLNSRDGGNNAGAMAAKRDTIKPGVPTGGTAEEYLRYMRGEAG